MGLTESGNRADVDEFAYVSGVVSVGTSQVEAKAGGSRRADRQLLLIHNDSSNTIYYGPSGVTTSGSTKGVPIFKDQTVSLPVGDLAVYLIAGSSSNDVIVQEFA